MKKLIGAMIIFVMIATPCFAQEVKPEGIFKTEGTLWKGLGLYSSYVEIGFYQGEVYFCGM